VSQPFIAENRTQKFGLLLYFFDKTAQRTQSPIKFAPSGHPAYQSWVAVKLSAGSVVFDDWAMGLQGHVKRLAVSVTR
jgi:hypothetical protein